MREYICSHTAFLHNEGCHPHICRRNKYELGGMSTALRMVLTKFSHSLCVYSVVFLLLNAHKEVANSGIPDEPSVTQPHPALCFPFVQQQVAEVMAGCFFTCLSLNAFIKVFFVFRSFSWCE